MAFGCLGYTGVDKPVFLICLILHLKVSVRNDSNDNLVWLREINDNYELFNSVLFIDNNHQLIHEYTQLLTQQE